MLVLIFYEALEPAISEQIMTLHHTKHHQTYINNLNNALASQATASNKDDIVSQLHLQSAINFSAGGHINHTLFWENLFTRIFAVRPGGRRTTTCSGHLFPLGLPGEIPGEIQHGAPRIERERLGLAGPGCRERQPGYNYQQGPGHCSRGEETTFRNRHVGHATICSI